MLLDGFTVDFERSAGVDKVIIVTRQYYLNLIRMLFSSLPEENAIAATIQLLKRLNVPVTQTAIGDHLSKHPHYPSLFSISDSLRQLKVENVCLRLNPEKLPELPVPFMTHLSVKNGLFVVVTSVNQNEIKYSDPEKRNTLITKTLRSFLKEWSGIALLARKTDQSGQANYDVLRKHEWIRRFKLPVAIISYILILSGFLVLKIIPSYLSPVSAVALVLIKFIGCTITALLLWHELGAAGLAQKICVAFKRTNCNAVLQSKEAKLFGISWSEIGFCYFSGSLLVAAITSLTVDSVWVLAQLNILALPFVFLSVYYQWKVIRNWCLLCLAVQLLLVSELLIFCFDFWSIHGLHLLFGVTPVHEGAWAIVLLTTVFVTVSMVTFSKSFIIKARTGEKAKTNLARLIRNKGVFELLLCEQERIAYEPTGLGITLGNPESAHTIIKVCNPYCGPSARAHRDVNELLEGNRNIKVRIIFAVTPCENDRASLAAKCLLGINSMEDEQLKLQALNDWYFSSVKNIETFSAKYSSKHIPASRNKEIEEMNDWCRETGISCTPTYFVNGFRLPDVYNLDDLKYIIPQ